MGGFAGVLWGPETSILGEVSSVIVQALKAVAVPLLFVAIVEALAKSHMSGRGFGYLALVTGINAIAALVIALLLINIIKPGEGTTLSFLKESIETVKDAPSIASTNWQNILASIIPKSLFEPFVSGSTGAVILIALAVGFALRRLSKSANIDTQQECAQVVVLASATFKILTVLISWLVYLMPIAVFCAVAKAVGKSGLGVAGGLGLFLVICVAGMLIQILVTYQAWITLNRRVALRDFWRAAKDPVAYAFGINSSLATLPMTLQALEDIEVREEAARLSACVGTNFNNDGILLYQVVAALILAQAFGMELTLAEQLYVAGVAVISTLGVAGFPEAGAIALMLVLSVVGLPAEAIVLLMSVDWLIARCRSATNVLGDMAVAVAIDRFLPQCPPRNVESIETKRDKATV